MVLIEPADGDEPELPANLREGVAVGGERDGQDVVTWVGKLVPRDKLGVELDLSLYREECGGLAYVGKPEAAD